MNFRQTAILIGSVLAAGVVLLALTFTGDDGKPDAASLAEELLGVKPEQIDTVEFERDSGSRIKLVRTDAQKNSWEMVEPYRVPADSFTVDAVVKGLMRAKPTAYPGLSSNPAVSGLDPPSLKVTLRGEGKSSTVNLGDVTIGGSKAVVFVTTSARAARPMAVPRSELDALFRDAKGVGKAGDLAKWTGDYRVKSVFPSDSRAAGEDVASVRLEMPNKKKELALTRAPGGAWKFDSPAGWGDADVEGDPAGPPGTFTGVRRLLGALTSVTAATPGDFIDNPKDLKEYGLSADDPDLVKVVLKTRDGQSATVYFGKREAAAPPVMPPGMPPHAPSGKVYVRVEGQPGVIRATAGDLSGLTGVTLDPSPLRDRTLVAADRAKVDGIDIVLAGQPADKPTKLRHVGQLAQWRLYGGPGDPQFASGAAVDKLLDVILAPRVIKDFPAPNPANFAAVSATVFVWADGFTPAADPKAEPAKKAEPVKIEFGRKDGDTVYVRRTPPGLPPDEFTIPAQVKVGGATETADALAAVSKSRLDLLDRSLPSFSDTVRIAVTGANSYTLTRDEKPDPLTKEQLWRFDPTDPRKGQVADGGTVRNEIIYRLANANSSFVRFIDEDPKPEKLAEYGFSPPRLKVVLDMPPNAEPKQVAFEFGKDDPADPDKVYARVLGRSAVFTMQRRAFDVCLTPDLRDRLIFRGVDAGAVNKVELRGWGAAGFITELTFEKNKDGVWAATKAPAGFNADPAKVSAFIELLTRAQVKAFEKGMPDPKHGFGDIKQYLQGTLHWPGGSAAFNFAASPDGGASYYGWAATLPQAEPLFTVDAALLKPFKDSTGGFAK